MQGKIIRGIAGFYYVHVTAGTEAKVYACKARGVFRKDNRKPLVGDDVEIDVLDEEACEGNIKALLPRKNQIIRPAAANVDQALAFFAVANPNPSLNLLDRFLITMGRQGIPCIVCFNKEDLDAGEGGVLRQIYASCGYRTLLVSVREGTGLDELKGLLSDKTTAVAGPSGAGKSSLVNCLQYSVHMETGQLSRKVQRGKHTTRHTELIAAWENTYILDTPGFGSLDLPDLEKEELAGFYPEFSAYEKDCRFGGCAHIAEPVCGVKEAVRQGRISPERYDNYCLLYGELKDRRKF